MAGPMARGDGEVMRPWERTAGAKSAMVAKVDNMVRSVGVLNGMVKRDKVSNGQRELVI